MREISESGQGEKEWFAAAGERNGARGSPYEDCDSAIHGEGVNEMKGGKRTDTKR